MLADKKTYASNIFLRTVSRKFHQNRRALVEKVPSQAVPRVLRAYLRFTGKTKLPFENCERIRLDSQSGFPTEKYETAIRVVHAFPEPER